MFDPVLEMLQIPGMQRACIAALVAAPCCALLGSFITLRGLSFFSDAIAHASLAGVALAFLFNLADVVDSPGLRIVLVVYCLGITAVMEWLRQRTRLRSDTLLALLFSGSMALGVILITRLRGAHVLENALFGDILATSWGDVIVISAISVGIAAFIFVNLRALALCTVNEDLAQLEGVKVARLDYAFVLAVALLVALLLRQIGAIVISGIIVIPAVAARVVAPSFLWMLRIAAALGFVGAVSGLIGSYYLDTPTGPSIVLSDVVLFIIALVLSGAIRGMNRKSNSRSASGESLLKNGDRDSASPLP